MTDVNQRLANMHARGVLRHADVKAGLAAGQGEFLRGENLRLEMPTGYGLATSPLPGADLFAAFMGGNRDHGVIVAHDDRRHRPGDLAAGEVALYSNVANLKVHLKQDGTLVIRAPTRIRIEIGDDDSRFIEMDASGIRSRGVITVV